MVQTLYYVEISRTSAKLEFITSTFHLLPTPFNALTRAFHFLIIPSLVCLTLGIFNVLTTLSLRLVGLLRSPMPTTLLFLISVSPRFIRLLRTPVPRAAFLVLCISTGVTSLVEGVATQKLN